ELLPANVLLPHVHLALEAEESGGRRRCDAVLASPGFGDDARLPHTQREEGLAEAVVDLVGAGVIEVLAFEEDASPAGFRGEPLRVPERRRPADVLREVVVEVLFE